MSFVKTGACAVVEQNVKVSFTKCFKCGKEYNSDLPECPYCKDCAKKDN